MRSWRPLIVGLLLLMLGQSQCAVQSSDVRAGTFTVSASTPADWDTGTRVNLHTGAKGVLELVPSASGLSSVGSFSTPAGTADFPFTHLAARWNADTPAGTSLTVEIRARSETGDWTSWTLVYDPQDGGATDGPADVLPSEPGIYGENLLALQDGRQMQARITFASAHPQASPVLHSISLIYIDASQGPTLDTAAPKARPASSLSADGVPAPSIIPRTAWGADESQMDWPPAYSPVRKVVIHHTVTENDEPDPAVTVRAIYYYHAIVRGWGDIGYNYLVDRFGNIYEGRSGGLDVVGGHVYGYNVGSLGIGSLGAFGNTGTSVEPSPAMLDSISALSAWTASRRLFHPLAASQFYDQYSLNLTGHRDYGSTACPGDFLYSDLPAIRAAAWAQLGAHHPAYAAAWGEHTAPERMLAGTTVVVSVAVQNAGTLEWPAGGSNPVRLGYHWYDAAGQSVALPSSGDDRSALPADSPFGAEITWTGLPLAVPETPGTYRLSWDLVHEGVTWFADQESPTLDVPVVVTEIQGHSYIPAVMFGRTEPTPAPDDCSQQIINGGFETDEGWTLNDTPADAHYTPDPVQTGLRALRVGIPLTDQNQFSYSSADQVVAIPAGRGRVTLSFWYYPLAAGDDDSHYIMVRGEDGAWYTVFSQRENAGAWLYEELDLSGYSGQTVTLRIGAFNDGSGGVTSLAVDEVSLLACP